MKQKHFGCVVLCSRTLSLEIKWLQLLSCLGVVFCLLNFVRKWRNWFSLKRLKRDDHWWTVQSDENKDQYIYTLPWRWNERLSIFIYLLVVIYFKVKKKKILYMWNGSNIWIEEFLVLSQVQRNVFFLPLSTVLIFDNICFACYYNGIVDFHLGLLTGSQKGVSVKRWSYKRVEIGHWRKFVLSIIYLWYFFPCFLFFCCPLEGGK